MLQSYEDILSTIAALTCELHQSWESEHNKVPSICAGYPGRECTCVAKPWWHDENGVPRFAAHHPNLCPDIYATEVVLLVVACQSCGREFPVQMSWSMGGEVILMAKARLAGTAPSDTAMGEAIRDTMLSTVVRNGTIHYGDPPNVGCCPAGPTMNVWDLRVLEFWSRNKPMTGSSEWRRIPELEIELPDATAWERTGEDPPEPTDPRTCACKGPPSYHGITDCVDCNRPFCLGCRAMADGWTGPIKTIAMSCPSCREKVGK